MVPLNSSLNAHASSNVSAGAHQTNPADSVAPLHPDDEEEIQSLLEKSAHHVHHDDEDTDDEESDTDDGHQLSMATASVPHHQSAPAIAPPIPNGQLASKPGWSNVSSKHQRKLLLKEMIGQTLPALILCMITALITGLLLERMQQWNVFVRIEELFILVPILLNLKGNLEMNLAARFSTSANIGELDLRPTRRALILGNLALLQVQALIVSLISGLLAFFLGVLSRRGVHHHLQHPAHMKGEAEHLRGGYFEALLVLCVSMLAASLSSAVLGSFMCALVVICRRFRINPDNLATPLASALGDMITLVLLGGLSALFAVFMSTFISTAVFLLLLAAAFVNIVITFRNTYVQELLTVGWAPLFIAMAISSGSGLVLEAYVNQFEGFALFAPAFTALSGAAGSIFVSRISTALHSSHREPYTFIALALFVLTVPVILLMLPLAWITGQVEVTGLFVVVFTLATTVQMAVALILAYYTSTILWKLDYDPDVYALPLLSSFLDVMGQLALVVAFSIASPKQAIPEMVGETMGGGAGGAAARRLLLRWMG